MINNGIDLDSIQNLTPAVEAFAALGLRGSEGINKTSNYFIDVNAGLISVFDVFG